MGILNYTANKLNEFNGKDKNSKACGVIELRSSRGWGLPAQGIKLMREGWTLVNSTTDALTGTTTYILQAPAETSQTGASKEKVAANNPPTNTSIDWTKVIIAGVIGLLIIAAFPWLLIPVGIIIAIVIVIFIKSKPVKREDLDENGKKKSSGKKK